MREMDYTIQRVGHVSTRRKVRELHLGQGVFLCYTTTTEIQVSISALLNSFVKKFLKCVGPSKANFHEQGG